MDLIKAVLVWLIMATIIGVGIVMAAKGSIWLLVLSLLVFIGMVAKIGCSVSEH